MYGVKIQPPANAIEDIQRDLQKSPTQLANALKRNTSRLRSRWEDALQVEPPPASNYTPLRYKSPRQRRKVHAMRNERGGGAYVRTHRLSKGWKVTITPVDKGGEVAVSNAAPEAQFVVGAFRQPMFDPARGGVPWLDPDVVNAQFAQQFGEVLQETAITILDPRAGVR